MSIFLAHVDGGSHGSPGPSGIGVVLQDSQGEKIRISKWIGHQDNNVAEYVALLEALQHALKLKAKVLHVFSDSQVVVRQMTGASWPVPLISRSLTSAASRTAKPTNSLTMPSTPEGKKVQN